MQYWFTSDLHLGHANIIRYCQRPFKSLGEMNRTIIKRWNERVKLEDIVFHIGDFCFKNSNDARGEGVPIPSIEWEKKLNGKIIHIKGNHDGNNSTKTIIQGMLIQHCGQRAYLVHKPEHYNPAYELNLVGHVHEKWEYKFMEDGHVLLLNVGVDVNKFMPLTFQEILKKVRRIKNGL